MTNDSANQIYVAKMMLQNDVAGPNNVVCRRHDLAVNCYFVDLSHSVQITLLYKYFQSEK